MINISIQKIPAGLKIISSEVGPPEISAAKIRLGIKLNERNVKKKMLSLDKKIIMFLFVALKKTNI